MCHGGELILHNTSKKAIACTVDGYTTATGSASSRRFQVPPGRETRVKPNAARNPALIDWVECGGLKTRKMGLQASSPDAQLVFNGQQTRVLNVLLYPFIPSNPNNAFTNLVANIIGVYQSKNPQVLLNVTMDQNVEIYKFPNVQAMFGPNGYDVAELDTVFMGFLVSNNLVTPVTINGDAPWPVGLSAVTINGQTYGVPSWLCTDFAFSFQPALKQTGTLAALLQYLATMPSTVPPLVADYDGSWNIPTMYINAYVQTYGYAKVKSAFNMPPDPQVIKNLASLASTCSVSGTNNCVNSTYHNEADGATEQLLATGQASNDLGFSEQSFYILLFEPSKQPVYAIPFPWGANPQPVLFTDAFVTNSATCSTQPCAGDSQSFTAMMTSAPMKTFIAFSVDLPPNSPPRHLLVATQPFWSQSQVQQDPLYQQFSTVLQNAQPFPNWFTQQNQTAMSTQVCAALQQQIPAYVCPASPPATAQTAGKAARRSVLH